LVRRAARHPPGVRAPVARVESGRGLMRRAAFESALTAAVQSGCPILYDFVLGCCYVGLNALFFLFKLDPWNYRDNVPLNNIDNLQEVGSPSRRTAMPLEQHCCCHCISAILIHFV
jgi:hypothetical protein